MYDFLNTLKSVGFRYSKEFGRFYQYTHLFHRERKVTGDPHVVHGCDNVCCLVSRSVETKRVDEDLQIDNDFRYLPINIH